MTLEEIKGLLEKSREKIETEKSKLLKQAEQFRDSCVRALDEYLKVPEAMLAEAKEKYDKTREALITYLDSCEKKIWNMSGIRRIEYNTKGEPALIQFFHGFCPSIDEQLFPKRDDSFMKYNETRLTKWLVGCDDLCGLHKISKKLEKEELKNRGITDEEIKLFGNASIHEITFDSILNSGFFSQKDIDRARMLAKNIDKFYEAVDAYTRHTTVLKRCEVEMLCDIINPVVEYDSESQKITYQEDCKEGPKDKVSFKYKTTDVETLDWLRESLKSCRCCKNGIEMIILLLLLDEMTPPKSRLKWIIAREEDSGYYYKSNTISMKQEDPDLSLCTLLHEIGHYLQDCFGLKQTFESYRNSFAEKLLLLKGDTKENEKTFSVPQPLCDLFEKFDGDCENKKIQKNFIEKDLFMRWQLVSRWSKGCEIPNILGVYFDRNNIYVNNFSEICYRKVMRYGHVIGRDLIWEKLGEVAFDDPEGSTIFENIVASSKAKKPDSRLIELLCKLNNVKFNKVINFFDEMSYAERWSLEIFRLPSEP